MDHLSTRLLARYALGDVTDDAELTALEDHLMVCDHCRRMAMAVDAMGTVPPESDDKVLLHLAAGSSDPPVAMCGDTSSRNLISPALLPGLDAAVLCTECLARLRGGAAQPSQLVQ